MGENFSSVWVIGHNNLRLVVIILNKVFTPEEQLPASSSCCSHLALLEWTLS